MTSLLARCSASVVLLGAVAGAQFDPSLFPTQQQTAPQPLPDLDIRLGADGRTLPFVREALSTARSPVQSAARALALRKLLERVPGVSVDDHEILGTPHFVRSTVVFLSPPVAGGAAEGERIVRDFLEQYRGLFEVPPGELLRCRVSRDFRTAHNGLRHLTWKQQIDGVDLWGCELRANLTERGELVNLSSTLIPRPGGEFPTSPLVIGDAEALRIAARSVGITLHADPEPQGAPSGETRRRAWIAAGDLRAGEPATTELSYFPRTRSDIRAAWSVVVPEIGIGNTYEITVDAQSGEILRRSNRLRFAQGGTQPVTFRLFPHESPAPGSPGTAAPNGFQFPSETQLLQTVTAASVAAWSPNGWIDDGVNETLGNNVDAHLDLDADDVADQPRPMGLIPRTFDFLVDLNAAPTEREYQSGVVTQLFYWSNRYHDRLYALGFDEAASNFQQANLTGQGVGGDRVDADAQDGSGTNNANFGTAGQDGSPGRMQMYVFTGTMPDRDGDLDADIVFHELTHGLSIRLTDGQVSGTQAGGMGEGWGDFVALCLNAESSDDPNAVYTVGGWTTHLLAPAYVDNYYFGIRRFPYTTDPNRNPQTYADIDPAQQSYPPAIPRSPVIGNSADEVHNVGEVWCNTLWGCRANLIAAHGFAGNDLILQLVVDGLKLGPGTPSFVQARDAILQADLVNSAGLNLTRLWTGFAARGLGKSATSPSGATSAGVHEAFDVPDQVLFLYPNGRPAELSAGQPTTFQVEMLGLGSTVPTPGTGQLGYSVNGGPLTFVALTSTAPNHYDATIPALNCLDRLAYFISVSTNNGTRTDPPGAPVTTFRATSASASVAVYADNFETDQGWAPLNLGATAGNWKRAVPVNDAGWDYDPISDADGSGRCWLTENLPGNSDVDNGSVQLTSRAFDFTAPNARLSYQYFLALSIADGNDRLAVEMSTSGLSGPWVPIAVHDTDGGLSWRSFEITATEAQALGLTPSTNTRVRFIATDAGAPSVVEAGLDAFRVSRLACALPIGLYCFGDGSGAACPCGNNGAAGQGCANSLGHGATLSGSGHAILAADTFVLTGAGMPNSSALYFQGTTQAGGGSGVTFGDGLRCGTGSIIRLGTKNNMAGASSYPASGDPAISVRGLVPAAGATRNYQVWYRNAASFCTASTFNLSNGVSVSWVP
ncbi:MAG: M36 family metallopeptidase [Planctomycetota bacterium]|nr:M36 family metallopeptidase [Planctomycetota bacterium]